MIVVGKREGGGGYSIVCFVCLCVCGGGGGIL